MKASRTLLNAMLLLLTVASPAVAAETAPARHSGILVLLFLGLFAVIVIAQMVPAIVMLFGVIKGVAGATNKAADKEPETAEKAEK